MSAEWLHWYYLIYLLPAAAAVLVLLLSGLGGHHGGHSHAASTHSVGGLHLHAHSGGVHGTSAAGHAHAPAGAHPTAHSSPAGAAHAAAHTHGSHHGHPKESRISGVGPQLLGFFGVGRAPVTIVIGSLLIGWGLFGLAATDLLEHGLHLPPVLFVAPSLAAAAVGGLVSAKLLGELAAKLMPKDESYAISREGLLGLTGKVVYPISETGGRVHVFDQFRTLHAEPARVTPGQAPIEKGTAVIVASMDPDHGYLIVEPLGFSRTAFSPQPSTVSEEETLKLQNRDT